MQEESYVSTLESIVSSKEDTIFRLDKAIEARIKKINSLKEEEEAVAVRYLAAQKSEEARFNERMMVLRGILEKEEAKVGSREAAIKRGEAALAAKEVELQELGKRLELQSEAIIAREIKLEGTFEKVSGAVATFHDQKRDLQELISTAKESDRALKISKKTFEKEKKEWMTKKEEEGKVLSEARQAVELMNSNLDAREAKLSLAEASVKREKARIETQWRLLLSAKKHINERSNKGSKPC